MNRRGWIFVPAVLFVMATGCISIEENVVVRPDGTAQYGVDFAMLEMFAQGLAGMAGEGEPSLGEQWLATADSSAGESVRLREVVLDADHHFAAERDFASLEQLAIPSGRSDAPASIRAPQDPATECVGPTSPAQSTWIPPPRETGGAQPALRATETR